MKQAGDAHGSAEIEPKDGHDRGWQVTLQASPSNKRLALQLGLATRDKLCS